MEVKAATGEGGDGMVTEGFRKPDDGGGLWQRGQSAMVPPIGLWGTLGGIGEVGSRGDNFSG